jgi:site-specific DNA-cytosine methylase
VEQCHSRGNGGGVNYYEACAGIGGIALGFQQAGFQIVGLCERDEWCQRKLRQIFSESEIDEDVYGITGRSIRERFGALDEYLLA